MAPAANWTPCQDPGSVLDGDIEPTVRIRFQVRAEAHRVTIDRIGNEKEVLIIHCQRPTPHRRKLTFRKTHHVLIGPVLILAIGI